MRCIAQGGKKVRGKTSAAAAGSGRKAGGDGREVKGAPLVENAGLSAIGRRVLRKTRQSYTPAQWEGLARFKSRGRGVFSSLVCNLGQGGT